MAYNWPSSHKAGTTTTGDADQRIDQARADINQNIVNVNEIIDMFDLASEPANGKILKYNSTSDKFEVADDASGSGSSTIGVQDMWIPADMMYPLGSNGCSALTTHTYVTQTLRSLDFDKDSDEFAGFSIVFPKKWNEGTITFEVYWTALSGTAGQNVVWGLQAVADSDATGMGTAFGTAVTVDDDLHNINYFTHISPTSSALTVGNSPSAGDIVHFQIYRDVSADNLGYDAKLIGIRLHYTSDAENDA